MRTPHPSSQKIVPIIPKVYFLKKCKKKSSRGTGLSRYAWKMVIKWSSGYILLGKMQTQLPATAAYEGGAPVEFCAVLTANICGIVWPKLTGWPALSVLYGVVWEPHTPPPTPAPPPVQFTPLLWKPNPLLIDVELNTLSRSAIAEYLSAGCNDEAVDAGWEPAAAGLALVVKDCKAPSNKADQQLLTTWTNSAAKYDTSQLQHYCCNWLHLSYCLMCHVTARCVVWATANVRVRTEIKMLLSRIFQDLQRPNSRVFQDSKIIFSRTFQDTFHSQKWVAWGQKSAYTKSVISLSALQQRIENAIPEVLLF